MTGTPGIAVGAHLGGVSGLQVYRCRGRRRGRRRDRVVPAVASERDERGCFGNKQVSLLARFSCVSYRNLLRCVALRAVPSWVISIGSVALAIVVWDLAIRLGGDTLLPGPIAVAEALGDLAASGKLFRFAIASLFRVTWGFTLAVVVGIPLGLLLGWFRRGADTVGPTLQFLRPISPLAWIPLAILWFGVGDASAVFLIFIASVLPLTLTAMQAVRGVHHVHVEAARNFGLSGFAIVRRVVFPAAVPQLVVGVRIALGIAWIVVVAAEMIAVNSGLGFLIVDSRNAGDRYDLVVAGMVAIGAIGLALDTGLRRIERGQQGLA